MKTRIVALLALIAAGALAAGRIWAGLNRPRGVSSWGSHGQGIRLHEVAAEAGLDFCWPQQGPSPTDIRQTFGAGCAFVDFDGDGWQDIFLVGDPTCGLFLNERNGHFRDISEAVGLRAFRGPWRGVAIGDYDGDGWPDILLTGYHRTALLRNRNGRSLVDVTRDVGLHDMGWSSSAGWADLDGDGDLDLVIGHYVKFGPGSNRFCRLGPGIKSGCPPSEYPAEFLRAYRNDGGHLVEITRTSGLNRTQGKNLALGFCDYDNDGDLDIFVANDMMPGDLFVNLGNLRFRNDNFIAGVAYGSDQASFMAGMGVDWGDFDNDGNFDLVVTNFANHDYALFQQEPPTFRHASARLGIAEVTHKSLGFGERFVDLDNDGFLDLVFANGHVYDNIHDITPAEQYRQPLIVMRNEVGQRYIDVSREVGAAAQKPIVGRGLAAGDYDNDGRVDLLVVDYAGSPLLLHNETETNHRWLGVQAREPGLGRDGHGARMTVEGPGFRLVRDVVTASSYLSSSDPRVLFGLGAHDRVDRLTVRWLGGKETVLSSPPLGRYLSVQPSQTAGRAAMQGESPP